jgi:glycosyltransferase involved in cell wall biosynthesis
MLWDKGVGDYVAAARLIHGQGLDARFALAGRTDSGNPASIPEAQLESWGRDGIVEWWGWQEDMPSILARASIICLPSYYREGVPTVLIEAAACARPLVATDTPGCRDIARQDINGLLVPVRDVPALAAALTRLIESVRLRQSMGVAGRRIVEEEFSSRFILGEILKVYAKASAKGV